MKRHAKSVLALASGAILLPGLLCQTAQARHMRLNESGTSTLADAFGTATGPEALIVSWSVVENACGIYTYTYTVNNPSGDVILNNNGQPTSTPEIVDNYSVCFDTMLPGAYLPGSQSGGGYQQNNGIDLKWYFSAVEPGDNSGSLSFESYLPPMPGNADAEDANPPSPWASIPDGQQVPVPDAPATVPEPTTTALLALTALFLPRSRSTLRKRAGLSQ
jgi:hypothetical protein